MRLSFTLGLSFSLLEKSINLFITVLFSNLFITVLFSNNDKITLSRTMLCKIKFFDDFILQSRSVSKYLRDFELLTNSKKLG